MKNSSALPLQPDPVGKDHQREESSRADVWPGIQEPHRCEWGEATQIHSFFKIISGDEPEVSHYSLHCERHREAVGDRPEEGIFLLSEIWVAYSTGWRPSIGACRLFWPLMRAEMAVLNHFFAKCILVLVSDCEMSAATLVSGCKKCNSLKKYLLSHLFSWKRLPALLCPWTSPWWWLFYSSLSQSV